MFYKVSYNQGFCSLLGLGTVLKKKSQYPADGAGYCDFAFCYMCLFDTLFYRLQYIVEYLIGVAEGDEVALKRRWADVDAMVQHVAEIAGETFLVAFLRILEVADRLVVEKHRERIFLSDKSGGEFLYVWIDIKLLFGGESAPVIHHHVSYGVSTATCAGDAHLFQFLESRNGIFDINIVNLNLLSGGDMKMRSGELVTYEGNLGKLLWGDETAGTAKAQHIVLVLALLVDAHRHAV